MAADLGEDAIGIVLSGTGHDGALGLKAVRARGGLTLAQGHGRHGTAAQRDAAQRHRDRGRGPDRARAGHARPNLVGIHAQARGGRPIHALSALQIDTARLSHLRGPVRPRRPRLQRLQGGDFSAPCAAPDAGAGTGGNERLPGEAGGGPRRGGAALPRPADRSHHLLPRRRCVRGGEAGGCCPGCSRARAPGTTCASGCRAAPPGRRRIRWQSCCGSTWTG